MYRQSGHPASRLTRDFQLTTMTREELIALAERIDHELDSRAFEENLRREVDSHLRRQNWSGRRPA